MEISITKNELLHKSFSEEPYISVIIPAINVDNWLNVALNLHSEKIKYEIIFIGPFKPRFSLPKNCRYIRSFVKPPQCLEIGFLESKGNLIMQFADDCRLSVEDPLFKIFDEWKKYGCRLNKLISCQYKTEEWCPGVEDYRFMPWDKSSPLIPITPLLPKILLKKFKTYDKRFVAVLADVDLYMRLIRGNVEFVFCEIFYIENKSINAGNLLLNDHWSKDKIMLDELWIDDITKPLEKRKFANIRKDEVSEFSHIDINISTQGPKGKWKYNNYFYNSIIHSSFFYFLKNLLKLKGFNAYLISLLKKYKFTKNLYLKLKTIKKNYLNKKK